MHWISALPGNHAVKSLRLRHCLLLLLGMVVPHSASALKGHVTHHRHSQAGTAYGGLQPVAGSHLYMFAISTSGYGSAPISLLNGQGVSYDASGHGYIVTGADGGFDITGLYASSCPTAGSSVYLQALGGNPGDGSNNSAIDLVTALPLVCSQEPNAGEVGINELTTVAAAWGLVRYASASASSLSANGANPQALLNAITYANNLVSGYDAQVGSTAYGGSLTVPVSTINAMGDILAECVNNGTASSACTQLFAYATPNGGTPPTDVFQAAIDIALNPANNASNIFNLVLTGAPFQPTLTAAPSSWTITYGISASISAQQRTVAIDHTQVQNTDQINFPVPVTASANPVLKSISNGGLVQSASGYDVLFTADSAGQNMLDFEIDNYNPATGAGTFWVRIPQLSHTTDTPIYMWFGIPNISNSLENSLGVWSNNYLSVYHFGNGTTLGMIDSAIGGYNLSGVAGVAPGLIGGAASFSGDPNMWLYHNNVPLYPSGSNPVTLEAWSQNEVSSGTDLIGYGNNAEGGAINLEVYCNSCFGQFYYGAAFVGSYFNSAWAPPGTWIQMVGVYGGGEVLPPVTQNYIAGQPYPDAATGGIPNIGTAQMVIGTFPGNASLGMANCCFLTGQVDEVRVSAGARSPDWIATESNTAATPTSFGRISPALLFTSSVVLSSSANPTVVGQTVTLTATVTGQVTNSGTIIPSGFVTFYDGTTALGFGLLSSSGGATLTTSTLPIGTQSITAVYSGDSNFTGSTAAPITLSIQGIPTISISNIPSSAKNGGSFTATYNYSGSGSPMESISSSTASVCTVLGNTVSYIAVGTCTLQASATATANYIAVTGPVQSFSVRPKSLIVLPSSNIINTIAGEGLAGCPNGLPPVGVELCEPQSVAVDSAGNIYIADTVYHRILMLSASTGLISSVAGTGVPGVAAYSGDGGLATSAEIGANSVAVDSAGNIYIADELTNHIRKVTTDGIISTIAGNGYIGSTGDDGGYSGDGGPATGAALNGPTSICVDSAGDIYFVDYYNDVIRKVAASGIISTVAGSGASGYSGDGGTASSAELGYPNGVAVDKAGNIYIADTVNNRIRMVDQSGNISTIAGNGVQASYPGQGDGGSAISAPLYGPTGIALDSSGNVFFSDDERIRMVTVASGIISTVAGTGAVGYSGDGGPAISATLNGPLGIAIDSAENIYIADEFNSVIRAVGSFLPTGIVSVSCVPGAISYGNTTTCTASVMGQSLSGTMTFAYNGTPWTSCTLINGGCSVSGLSNMGGGFYNITANYSGNSSNAPSSGYTNVTIYEATTNSGPTTPTISINDIPSSAKVGGSFTVTYRYSGSGSPSVSSSSSSVCTVAGNVVSYVGLGRCTLQASATSATGYMAATGSAQSFMVTANNLALAFPGYIDTIAGNGSQGYSGDGGAAVNAGLNYSSGVALDNAGNIYIADQFNNRVRMVSASTGVISTVAGNGIGGGFGDYSGDGGPAINAEISDVAGIAVDSAGNLYIADALNNRIRMVNTSGIISTVAGNGIGGFSGDGGLATSAEIWQPNGVAVDSAGNLYIADFFNGRIRKVTANGIISTVAGGGAGSYGIYPGDGGPATSAAIGAFAVTVDNAGNLYIPDYYGRVRKVTAATGIISTVAGNGTLGYAGDGGLATSAELASPSSVAVDGAGNIYIADSHNQRIRMVTASTGDISTIAGNGTAGYSGDGGSATSAELSLPYGVAVDSAGNVYIADANNNVVRLRAAGIPPPAASISVSCTPNAIAHGTPTTCTATVTGSSPTGTATFVYNHQPWTSCTLSNGSCSVSGLSSLGGGFYTIVGIYSGDANNGSARASVSLTVSPTVPTISVVSSSNPSTYGAHVTFTATVNSDDTNAVTFYSGGTPLGTATPSNGIATLTTSSLPQGTDIITATIAAGESYEAAAFSGITQIVNAASQTDTGTVALYVNGGSSPVAQTTYGAGSTPSSIAEALAAGASSSLVKVSATDNTLYIESTATGAGAAYPYSFVILDTAGFSTPSFSASPSGGFLQGASSGGSEIGQTIYSYCVSGPSNTCSPANLGYDPVGNLLGYTDSVMGTWSFGYDSLNRLVSGVPAAGNTGSGGNNGLSLCWSYDSFGNRTAESNQSGGCPSSLMATATYNSSNQVTGTSVHAAVNGFGYDAAGDVINDGLNTYLYDGDGRICAVMSNPAPGMSFMTGYLYDADGTRVAKGTITSMSCDPAVNGFQTTTDYVLGLGGEQVTEMGVDANGTLAHQHTNVWAGGKLLATYDNDGLHFYLDDPLGTRRVQTDYAGVVEQQCASLPYGNGESCSATPTEHLFTSKERDAETGNDYFGARYYASLMGRWMSPDWSVKEEPVPYAKLGDPQTLNLYDYVRNNPLSVVDPDGHEETGKINFHPPVGGCFGNRCYLAGPQQAQQQQTESKATVGERAELGAEATANVIVGLPKAAGGAAALVVGLLGSETGVGLGVAANGGYELVQGSGQLTSALYQGRAAVTGKSKGVDEAVDTITVHTSIVAYGASKLNGGNMHAAAKYGALEGIVTGGIKGELFKGVRNMMDTIMSFKDWVTK